MIDVYKRQTYDDRVDRRNNIIPLCCRVFYSFLHFFSNAFGNLVQRILRFNFPITVLLSYSQETEHVLRLLVYGKTCGTPVTRRRTELSYTPVTPPLLTTEKTEDVKINPFSVQVRCARNVFCITTGNESCLSLIHI